MPSKQHSELGASISHRWLACPGSVNATRGIDSLDSTYAQEGTAAHELAALVLEGSGVSAYDFIGSTFVEGFPVTEVMAEFVETYVDHCLRLIDLHATFTEWSRPSIWQNSTHLPRCLGPQTLLPTQNAGGRYTSPISNMGRAYGSRPKAIPNFYITPSGPHC